MLLVGIYRHSFSLFFGGNCRFQPSCSEYASYALQQHKLGPALYLITHRLCRCHPWGDSGYDPVPTKVRSTNVN